MKTALIANVHIGRESTFQTGDYHGYKNFSSEGKAEKFILDNDLDEYWNTEETYIDNELGINLIYLKTQTYNHNRERFESLFDEGFSKLAQKYWDNQEKRENQKREKQGFVRHKKHDEMKTKDYIGNLDQALTSYVKQYISSSGVFGYLGHSWRKYAHDDIIEKVFRKVSVKLDGEELDKWDLLGIWLTSSDARHWMDSVEDTSLTNFKKNFVSYIPSIVKLGFVYGLDNHEGTFGSTRTLLTEYGDRLDIRY